MSFELPAYHSVTWLICLQHTGANTHRPANTDHTYNAPTRGAVTFVPRFNGGGSVSYTSRWSTGSRQQITTPQVYPVGYAGHVPGLVSGNLHGAPWRDLLTPRSVDSITGTATSPRLINLSSLTQIDAGADLTVGFVLKGATARTVLVRGIGPSLGTIFGIGGVMSDPKLELFNNDTGSKITENDNWGGDSQLMNAAASVGAFALADTATKDAVLLVTLAPGAYSARVSGIGSSAGTAIVEVYELP